MRKNRTTIVKNYLVLVLLFLLNAGKAQTEDSLKYKRPPYNRKEEILYQNKRYRIHNNYLTLGGGFLVSTLRSDIQSVVAADYQFRIKWQQFQAGAMMSGDAFLSNNYTQVHVGYGYRDEKYTRNYALYGGLTYFSGVSGIVGQPEDLFDGFGLYFSTQAVYKPAYDIGIGVEVFGEFNYKQRAFGIKLIAFFSGAYRGAKKRVNPNVRTPAK